MIHRILELIKSPMLSCYKYCSVVKLLRQRYQIHKIRGKTRIPKLY